jgi:hypothetical protein
MTAVSCSFGSTSCVIVGVDSPWSLVRRMCWDRTRSFPRQCIAHRGVLFVHSQIQYRIQIEHVFNHNCVWCFLVTSYWHLPKRLSIIFQSKSNAFMVVSSLRQAKGCDSIRCNIINSSGQCRQMRIHSFAATFDRDLTDGRNGTDLSQSD